MAEREGFERKATQALTIQNSRPWDQAEDPMTLEGKSNIRRNAFKGGKRPALREDVRQIKQLLDAVQKMALN
jgi:hypothetical protein